MSVLVQWLWSLIPVVYPLTKNQAINDFFMPHGCGDQTVSTPAENIVLSEGANIVLIILAVVFAISVIVYVIVAVPRAIGRAGQKITQKSAATIIPSITHHKKISQKKRRQLTRRITWSIKSVLVFLPALMLMLPIPPEVKLTDLQFKAAGLVLLVFSLVMFLTQYVIARLARLKSEKIW